MAIIKIKNQAIDLDAAEIPNLPASKITSGTFADARIADLAATKLTGSISDARLPANALNSNIDLTNLSASNLTSGTIPTARITALPAGVGGKVLQVKHDLISTKFYVTGTTITTIWTGDTLTLANSSNKVLINGDFSVGGLDGGTIALEFSVDNGSNYTAISTADMGSTDGLQNGVAILGFHMNYETNNGIKGTTQTSFNYLHSPGNTSAKYRLRAAASNNGRAITINRRVDSNDWGGFSNVYQMEVSV